MHLLFTIVTVATLSLAALSAPATAAEPGISGEPSCTAHTLAWLAQGGATPTHGLGNVAAGSGGDSADPLSVQDLHDLVERYCSGAGF